MPVLFLWSLKISILADRKYMDKMLVFFFSVAPKAFFSPPDPNHPKTPLPVNPFSLTLPSVKSLSIAFKVPFVDCEWFLTLF